MEHRKRDSKGTVRSLNLNWQQGKPSKALFQEILRHCESGFASIPVSSEKWVPAFFLAGHESFCPPSVKACSFWVERRKPLAHRAFLPGHPLGNTLGAWAAIHFWQMTNNDLQNSLLCFSSQLLWEYIFGTQSTATIMTKPIMLAKRKNRPKRYKVIVGIKAGELLRWVVYKIA